MNFWILAPGQREALSKAKDAFTTQAIKMTYGSSDAEVDEYFRLYCIVQQLDRPQKGRKPVAQPRRVY